MKFFVPLFLLAVSFPALSAPFGKEITMAGLSDGNDQSGCEGQQILEREYEKSGINYENPPFQWTCDGGSAGTAIARRCPYPQYLVDHSSGSVNCMSNTANGPFVCIIGGSSAQVKETYGGSDRLKARPRFKQIYASVNSMNGNRYDRFIKMDRVGCQVTSFRDVHDGSDVINTYDECSKRFAALLSGANIYDFYDPDTTPNKFCDPKKAKDRDSIFNHESGLRELSFCFQNIPNFMQRYLAGLEATVPVVNNNPSSSALAQ